MAIRDDFETTVEPLARLMRDHAEILELVEAARERTAAALAAEGDSALAATALEQIRDLAAYLAEDLAVHIAKEEEVLFPALRGLAVEIDQVVGEMVEQHDEVRFRRANIERSLAALDQAHDEVEAASAGLAATLARAEPDALTPGDLAGLLDGVKRLEWILQGHFGDEEDDLFVPALQLLTTETFAQLAESASALDL